MITIPTPCLDGGYGHYLVAIIASQYDEEEGETYPAAVRVVLLFAHNRNDAIASGARLLDYEPKQYGEQRLEAWYLDGEIGQYPSLGTALRTALPFERVFALPVPATTEEAA